MPQIAGSMLLLAVFVLIYAAFLFWYGGRGEPMSAAEVEQRLADIKKSVGPGAQGVDHADGEILGELKQLAAGDDGNEFFMVNLIKYRATALYPAGTNYGDDARVADATYSRALAPYLLKYGGVPVFMGKPIGRFIDKSGDMQWDRVIIVRYRSRRDLFRMAADVAPLDVAIHKWASIEKTQVFPVGSGFNLIAVRVIVVVVLVVLAMLLHFAFFRIP